jgi:hypothetical protein
MSIQAADALMAVFGFKRVTDEKPLDNQLPLDDSGGSLNEDSVMRAQDIVIGQSYRHKNTPDYAWAKAVKVLKPLEGENTHKKIIVKCEWSVNKDDAYGFIKYFSPSDLIKEI